MLIITMISVNIYALLDNEALLLEYHTLALTMNVISRHIASYELLLYFRNYIHAINVLAATNK